MEDLITFIDSFALDDQLYWRIPHLYEEDKHFELRWQKSGSKERWSLRGDSLKEEIRTSSAEIPAILTKHFVDLERAKRQIGASIITQAVFASLVVEAAEKIFGPETLQQAFQDTNRFLKNVLAAVKDEDKPKLSLSPKLSQ